MNAFDNAPEILEAFAREGILEKPSAYYESTQGSTIADRILGVVQAITESPKAFRPIADAHWHLLRLGPNDGSLVLADRPLIRVGDIKTPDAIWILPISPKAAFVAAGHPELLKRMELLSKFQACRQINIASARQAERFVFSIDAQDAQWLGKYLDPRRRN